MEFQCTIRTQSSLISFPNTPDTILYPLCLKRGGGDTENKSQNWKLKKKQIIKNIIYYETIYKSCRHYIHFL